jgi:hypothetical protein
MQPSFCNETIKGGILGPKGCIINAVWAKVKGLKVHKQREKEKAKERK